MTFRLVQELAAGGVRVAVACRAVRAVIPPSVGRADVGVKRT